MMADRSLRRGFLSVDPSFFFISKSISREANANPKRTETIVMVEFIIMLYYDGKVVVCQQFILNLWG